MATDTFSSVSLFFREGYDPTKAKITSNLGKVDVEESTIRDNLSFNLEGVSLDAIKNFLNSVLPYLSERKRSQVTIFRTNDVVCITVQDGELIEM